MTTTPFGFLAQRLCQRRCADKGHVVELPAKACLARRAHKGCAGRIGADLHDDIRAQRHQRLDRLAHIHRIALHRGRTHRLEAMGLQYLRHTVEAGLAIGIVLVTEPGTL